MAGTGRVGITLLQELETRFAGAIAQFLTRCGYHPSRRLPTCSGLYWS